MPRAYAIEGTQNIANPATILGITASTAVKPGITFLTVGLASSASPVDISVTLTVQRYTAAGTATAVTPRVLDTGNVAAVATAGEDHTVEPTYTSNIELLVASMNARNTFQWYAYPGNELFATASSANGLGLKLQHASDTSLCTSTIHFLE